MSKTLKQVRCGRLVCAVVYTQAAASDAPRARQQKMHASCEAREKLNARTSFQKLERVLAANFDNGDLWVTLTYKDEKLPYSRERSLQRLRKFCAALRTARKKRGEDLKYVYVTEGDHPGGRIHHHMVANSTGADLQEIKALWTQGDVEIERLTFDASNTYEALAVYMTKEPREHGHPKVGERMWTPSLGLLRPEPETISVPDYLTLSAPPDAVAIEYQPPTRNGFGEYSWIKYLLPKDKTKHKRAKRRARKKSKE